MATPRPSRWRSDWLLLFAVAVAARVTAALILDGFRHPDLNEYEDIARSVVAGTGYRFYHLGVWYYSFAAPLFGGICAAIYALGGTVGVVVALQIVVSALHTVIVAHLAEQLFGTRRAGWCAGALMAVHPGLIVYASAKAHDLTFDALFFTLVLWMFWRLEARPTLLRAVIAGIVVGIGAHSRGTTVVFLPISAAWILWQHRRDHWRLYAGRVAVSAVCMVAVLTPWATRNIRIHHAFVWMLTTDGESLWDGNNPNATGHSYSTPDRIVLDMLPPDDYKAMRAQPNEVAQSRWFTDQAIRFITANPGRALELFAIKFYAFWWFSPQTGTIYTRSWLEAYRAYYSVVVLLALTGAWVAVRRDAPSAARWLLLMLFLLGLSALQSAYYVEGRHRWAIEPLVLLLAGGGAAWWLERWWGRRATS